MKQVALLLSGLVLGGGALCLLQMWFSPFKPELFIKLLVTLAVVGGMTVIVMLIRTELVENKQLKKDNVID